ncbi:Lysine-specific histone demethylase 1-like 1 [Hondaea fermentalgiana]|uniref:Lysine-specific histone demethylase 1-like 1 n=1 Tax=Hondaea fermentalgiana TaxID=2315210 RepID=A0A2R5GDS7_9STRA|nr:Lysine-specific histone demethylase 1-like 1 [Hondaea fermentalgiana]|eukprot:GBG29086.1 Lysine-specific histone demethylase 1-like 1 [Hondaea fermentalgiana]
MRSAENRSKKRRLRQAHAKPRHLGTVVVVGAGLAGLAAAQELRHRGLEVIVLEARDRVGGRVHVTPLANGVARADLGASFIHGIDDNPVAQLAQRYHKELYKQEDSVLFDANGREMGRPDDRMAEDIFNEALEAAAMQRRNPARHPNARRLADRRRAGSKKQRAGEREQGVEPTRRSRRLGGAKALSLVLIKHEMDQERDRERDHRANETDADADADADVSSDASSHASPDANVPANVTSSTTADAAAATEAVAATAAGSSSLLGGAAPNAPRSISLQAALDRALEVVVPELTPPQRRALEWNMSYLEYSLSSNLDTVSNEDWDADDEFSFSGAHCMVQGGIGSIAENLQYGVDIRKAAPVATIAYGQTTDASKGPACAVTTEAGEVFHADACLVTVPLGVLKANKITFEPALPEEKCAAISRLSFGVLNKVVMVFDSVFWSERSLIAYASEKRGHYPMFWDASQACGAPVLIALVSGRTAEALERKADQTVLDEVLEVLRLLYGTEAVATPKDFLVTRWRADPYARGSYSYVGLDASEEDYDLLAAPVAASPVTEAHADFRLFFAGEATNKYYPATVHGAFMSGIREARHIASLLARNEELSSSATPDEVVEDHAAAGQSVRDNVLRRLGAVASASGRLAVPRPRKKPLEKLSVAYLRRYIIHNFSFTPPALPAKDAATKSRQLATVSTTKATMTPTSEPEIEEASAAARA